MTVITKPARHRSASVSETRVAEACLSYYYRLMQEHDRLVRFEPTDEEQRIREVEMRSGREALFIDD
jgi:hypothetical protein